MCVWKRKTLVQEATLALSSVEKALHYKVAAHPSLEHQTSVITRGSFRQHWDNWKDFIYFSGEGAHRARLPSFPFFILSSKSQAELFILFFPSPPFKLRLSFLKVQSLIFRNLVKSSSGWLLAFVCDELQTWTGWEAVASHCVQWEQQQFVKLHCRSQALTSWVPVS